MALKMQEQTSVGLLSVNTVFKFCSILNYLNSSETEASYYQQEVPL